MLPLFISFVFCYLSPLTKRREKSEKLMTSKPMSNIDEQYEVEVDYKGKPWHVLIPIAIFAVSVAGMIFIGMIHIQ